MKWTKFGLRDAKGRFYTGHWWDDGGFSATKAPKIWTRLYDAKWRMSLINSYSSRPWAQERYAYPLEVVEVEVSVGEVRPTV